MIKIVRAEYVSDFSVDLFFSNGKQGRYDFSVLLTRSGELVVPLRNVDYFKQYFLELGAICWRNGLELSGASLYKTLEQSHALKDSHRAA